MPLYSSKTAALALGLSAKDLDNLLSRLSVTGVVRGHQGRDRRIGGEALVRIAIARDLRTTFGCSWRRAIAAAEELQTQPDVRTAGGLVAIRLTASTFRERLQERLADASEYVIPRRRGRPSRSR